MTKKCAISIWIGKSIPKILVDIVNSNAKLFNNFYLITDTPADWDNHITILDPHPYHSWIYDYFNITKLPAGNYQADILTYYSKVVLSEYYELDYDVVMKLDTDLLIYNRPLLDELMTGISSFTTLSDQCLRLDSAFPTYRNAAVSILGPNSEEFNKDNLTDTVLLYCRKFVRDWLQNPTNKYTAIGPSLTNSPMVSRSLGGTRSKLDRVECMTVHPGRLSSGHNLFYLDKSKLGLHLTQSDLKKYGFDPVSIQVMDGKCVLIVNDLCNYQI